MKANLDSVKNTLNFHRIILNLILLILCIAIIILTPSISQDSTSALYMTLMSLGVVGAFIFLINIIFRSKSETYLPTRSRVQKFSINFTTANTNAGHISGIIDNLDPIALQSLSKVDNGGILVEFKYSKDNQFGAYQISNYIPYQYEVVFAWKEINPENIRHIKKILSV